MNSSYHSWTVFVVTLCNRGNSWYIADSYDCELIDF